MGGIRNNPKSSSFEHLEPRRLFTALHGMVPAGEPQPNTLPMASIEWANALPHWYLESLRFEKLLWNDKVLDTMYLPLVEILEKRELLATSAAGQLGLGSGLIATYYDNINLTGPAVARVDPSVNFNWGNAAPAKGMGDNTFSARWEGYVEAKYTQPYTFSTTSDDGVRLWVDNQLLIDNWTNHSSTVDTGAITLKGGRRYAIRMEYFDSTGGAVAQLRWSSESQPSEIIPSSQLFPGQGPYHRAPFAVGHQIEAEDFDHGGQDISYYDHNVVNDLGHYRTNTGVDIGEVPGGGHYVGSTKAGEWLEYTIHVAKSTTYDLHLRSAAKGAGGVVHLEADGRDQTGPIPIPNTNGWQIYTTTRTAGLYLSAGEHVLRLSLDSAGGAGLVGHINWLKLVPSNLTVLPNGKGFVGATPEPATVSPEAKYGDAKAIARWDVVPYQTFGGNFNIGVVAFHAAGIEKVSFSVNGGEWQDVYEMTLNPETDVIEYWATLRALNFADGQLEVRAVAYPAVGMPRVLSPLMLHADADNSQASPELHVNPLTGNDAFAGTAAQPFATLKRALRGTPDGATIVLDVAGRYEASRHNEGGHTDVRNTRWITIRAAEGLAQEEVVIIAGGADRPSLTPRVFRAKWQGVSFDYSAYSVYLPSEAVWFDGCRFFDPNGIAGTAPGQLQPFRSGTYVTNSIATNMAYGFVGCDLVRDSVVNQVADAFQNSRLVINSVVDSMNVADIAEQHHPDIFQYYGNQDNIIVYGVTARNVVGAQVLFLGQPVVTGDAMTNAAFVNVSVDVDPANATTAPFSQMQGTMKHVLFKNLRLVNQQIIFRNEVVGPNHFSGHNMLFSGSLLNPLTYTRYVAGTSPEGVEFIECTAG